MFLVCFFAYKTQHHKKLKNYFVQVSNIKSFMNECNWKGINHTISRNDFSRFEKII